MTDEKREKVIKSLETAIKNFERYSGDEYGREYDYARVGVDVLEDALALLKAQEARVMTVRKQPTIDAIPVEWLREKIDGYASRLRSRELDSLVMVLMMWQNEQEAR